MDTQVQAPRVFVIEHPRREYDWNKAKKHGELKFVFGPGDRRRATLDTDELIEDIQNAFIRHNFDPDRDLFCMVGSMNLIVFTVVALLQYYKRVKVLAFSATSGEYVKRTLGVHSS